MDSAISRELKLGYPAPLVDQLLTCYEEMRTNFYLGRLRPAELEAGRFSDVAIRMLQYATSGTFTDLNRNLGGFDHVVEGLEQMSASKFHDSLRIHIPRVLLAIYNIRNRRDVGHPGGDVNPNSSDSLFVVQAATWVLTELVRLGFGCPVTEAQSMVDGLVEKRIPLVWEIDGLMRVLNPDLKARDKALAVLYVLSPKKASDSYLMHCIDYKNSTEFLTKVLDPLSREALVHRKDEQSQITPLGIQYVEKNIEFALLGH